MLTGFLDTEALWLRIRSPDGIEPAVFSKKILWGRGGGRKRNIRGETPNGVMQPTDPPFGKRQKPFCMIAPPGGSPLYRAAGKKGVETSRVRLGYFWHQECLAACCPTRGFKGDVAAFS